MLALIIAIAVVAGFILFGSGDEVDPNLDYPTDVSKAAQIEFLMQEHLVSDGMQPVHSFVMYVENAPEGILIQKGVGTIGRNDTLIDEDYQYNIASITKTVVATIILQLMEEGKLALDDHASQYLADIDYLRFSDLLLMDGESHSDKITIDQLLQHRTGIASVFNDTETRFNVSVLTHPKRQYSPERFMDTYFDYHLNERPHFKPGEGYFYSDVNYVLLGLIIEQITGESLPDQIRRRVLQPMGMDETYFEFYEDEVSIGKRLDSYLGPINMTRFINTSYEWAGGGLVSTTEDMAIFIEGLFDLELFEKEATLDLMIDNTANRADDETYARGINHYSLNGVTYYGHGGFYGSLLAHHPEEGITLSAHIAQAMQPYNAEPLVEAILEVVEAP
jgi:D-alanyl-D-alanine carboxypeptidase